MAPHQLSVGHICRRGSPSFSGFSAAAEDLGVAASVTMQSPTLAMGMLLRLLDSLLRQNRPLPQAASSSPSSSSSLPLLLLGCLTLPCLGPSCCCGCKLVQLGRPVHCQPPEVSLKPVRTRQQAGNLCADMTELAVQHPAKGISSAPGPESTRVCQQQTITRKNKSGELPEKSHRP